MERVAEEVLQNSQEALTNEHPEGCGIEQCGNQSSDVRPVCRPQQLQEQAFAARSGRRAFGAARALSAARRNESARDIKQASLVTVLRNLATQRARLPGAPY